MLELYTDYLLSSFGATTATGLSATLEGAVSHDQVTRFLSREDYNSKTRWQQVKPMVRVMEQPDGVLIFDDTIEEKPHTDENELISWHFDHSRNRSVKGINILNCVYHAGSAAVPVAYELIRKPLLYRAAKTGRLKRKSAVTKNELMRRMLRVCQRNQCNTATCWRTVGFPPGRTWTAYAKNWTDISLLGSSRTGRLP